MSSFMNGLKHLFFVFTEIFCRFIGMENQSYKKENIEQKILKNCDKERFYRIERHRIER